MGLMNGLTFGGINSLDYGIYISGEAVFNAPEREVEMLQVPGRNGDFVLDHGRFENIEVSYPAGTFGDDQTDFREKLSDFRNAILSQVGYQRLTDTYHPDEYRMGVYASGLEVAPVHYNTAGEFVLTFNCKPQRWLTSGEDAVAIADGGKIDNPTLFESSPLLEVWGYGNININTNTIKVANALIGNIVVSQVEVFEDSLSDYILFDDTYANVGDTITVETGSGCQSLRWSVDSGTITGLSASASGNGTVTTTPNNYVTVILDTCTFNYGTSKTETVTASLVYSTSNYGNLTVTFAVSLVYDGNNKITINGVQTLPPHMSQNAPYRRSTIKTVTLDSTQYSVGAPLYIDLDIGECYKIESDVLVPINNAVYLPSRLSVLESGSNTITYDNTFTQVKITPRWWKV